MEYGEENELGERGRVEKVRVERETTAAAVAEAGGGGGEEEEEVEVEETDQRFGERDGAEREGRVVKGKGTARVKKLCSSDLGQWGESGGGGGGFDGSSRREGGGGGASRCTRGATNDAGNGRVGREREGGGETIGAGGTTQMVGEGQTWREWEGFPSLFSIQRGNIPLDARCADASCHEHDYLRVTRNARATSTKRSLSQINITRLKKQHL